MKKRAYKIKIIEDFDLIWNLDDEIFDQIDVESTEDIKSLIHRHDVSLGNL